VARLFAFAVWLNGLRAVPVVILTRDLRFGPYAATEVLQQIVYYGVAVALAALGYGVVSFGIGAVAQSFVGTAGLWLAVRRAPHVVFDRAIARRLLGFGVGYQLAYVLHWARESVIAIFGGLAGGLRAIGLIQFAWRNGGFALTVEEIVARVAFPAFSRLQSSASIGGAATRAVEVSFLAVAVIQAWLLATAPSLVPAVFSDQWTPAVPAFQLVCAGALAWAPVLILRSLVYSSGDSRQGLMLAAVSLVIMYVAFPVLLLLLGIVGAGLAYAVGNVLALGLYVRATSAVFTFPWRSLVRITSEVGAAAIVAAIIAMMIPGLPGLAASGVAYLAIVALLLFVFEPSLVATLRALLRARPRAAAEQVTR
jgi:PST family polysaccharide transporter